MQRSSRIASLVTTVLLVGVFVLVWTHRNELYDWARLRDYTPPAAVTSLADQTTMTSSARRLFYVNRPQIQDRDAFNVSCPSNGGEQTIILGCYHDHETGIFVYNVTDAQLSGVQQVTAAHEMLHGAYERLSPHERDKVDALLEDFYANGLQDKRVKDTIDAYKKSEPNDLVNEMHSIFGTEVASLPPALEAYYKQYFTNRQQVVAYATQYQQAFTSREAQIAQYDAQLKSLKADIEQKESDLEAQAAVLNSTRSQVERSNDRFQIEAYNAKVGDYNSLLQTVNGQINQFNSILDKRNAIALEEKQLYQSINSGLAPQAAQ